MYASVYSNVVVGVAGFDFLLHPRAIGTPRDGFGIRSSVVASLPYSSMSGFRDPERQQLAARLAHAMPEHQERIEPLPSGCR
jgi:hypothetical protein